MRYRSDQHAEDWSAIERRQLLRMTAGTVAASLTRAAAVTGDGPSGGLVAELEATTRRLRDRDHRFGTPTALVQATAHVERLTSLLRRTRGDHPLHPRLAGVAGDAAQLVGWMAFDQVDLAGGAAWFQLAADLARRSRNADLIIASAAMRSRIGWLQTRLPAHALRFLDDAQRQVARLEPSPAGVAYLHAHRANVWARAGAAYQTLTELDRADVALDADGPPASGLVFLSHVNRAHLDLWRGHLSMKLRGDHAGGATTLLSDLAERLRRTGYLRATGELYLDLGESARLRGDHDLAAHLGVSALQIANDTQSLRHLSRAKSFHASLPSGPLTTQFGDYLRQVGAFATA